MAIGRIPEPGTGIPESIVDAKGDIVTATAADTPARLAVGTNDHRLVAASGEATGLKYVADTQNTVVDAKGDLLVGTAADTIARLAVGTNGYTLVADSAETTGLKWQAPAAGSGLTLITNQAFSAVSSYSLPANTFSSTYTNYKVILDITSFSQTNTFIARLRASGTDTSSADYVNTRLTGTGTAASSSTPTNTSFSLGSPDTNTNYIAELTLYKPNVAIKKWCISQIFYYTGTWDMLLTGSRLDTVTQYDSMSFIPSTGTITGRVYVYGLSI